MTDTLLERVKKAVGPDRAIDGDLFIEFTPGIQEAGRIDRDFTGGVVGWWPTDGPYQSAREVPRYTASIDAALALLDRVLPGAEWTRSMDSVNTDGTELVEIAWRANEDNDWIIEIGRAHSTPLAILAALLQAKGTRP